jgi:hypothetical protein
MNDCYIGLDHFFDGADINDGKDTPVSGKVSGCVGICLDLHMQIDVCRSVQVQMTGGWGGWTGIKFRGKSQLGMISHMHLHFELCTRTPWVIRSCSVGFFCTCTCTCTCLPWNVACGRCAPSPILPITTHPHPPNTLLC